MDPVVMCTTGVVVIMIVVVFGLVEVCVRVRMGHVSYVLPVSCQRLTLARGDWIKVAYCLCLRA